MSTQNKFSSEKEVKKQSHKVKYGCLYAPINGHYKTWLTDWCRDVIPTHMLFNDSNQSYGRESDPHCTVLFGLKTSPLYAISKIISQTSPFWITLGPLHLFQNPVFDVLIAPITSPEIINMHNKIKQETINEERYPYFPHITIAYTKKNVAKIFIGRTDFMDTKILINQFIYSRPKTGQKTTFLLEKR